MCPLKIEIILFIYRIMEDFFRAKIAANQVYNVVFFIICVAEFQNFADFLLEYLVSGN
jgi:hypothetical protein